MKAAQEHLTKLTAEGEKQLDYLNSVLELLESAESEKDVSDLRRELIATRLHQEQEERQGGQGEGSGSAALRHR